MNYLPGIQASSRWYLHAQGSPYVLNPIPQNFSPELSLKQFQCWPFFILSRKIVEHFLVLCLPPPGDRWYVLGWYTRAVSTWILHNCCSAALCPTVSHERQCYLISLSLSPSQGVLPAAVISNSGMRSPVSLTCGTMSGAAICRISMRYWLPAFPLKSLCYIASCSSGIG